MRGQCSATCDGSSSTVIPSMPGLPLFFFTRRSAASTFLRSTTRAMRSSPSLPERSLPSAGRDVPAVSETHARFALLAVRPFTPSKALLAPRFVRIGNARRPFRRRARSPQVRTLSFSARAPGLRRLSLGHRSFAVHCPLAPLADASYPVSVRRPAVSLPASFPRSVALSQLRFASFRMTSLRPDLHRQDSAHAGRTTQSAPAPKVRGRFVNRVEALGIDSFLYESTKPAEALRGRAKWTSTEMTDEQRAGEGMRSPTRYTGSPRIDLACTSLRSTGEAMTSAPGTTTPPHRRCEGVS